MTREQLDIAEMVLYVLAVVVSFNALSYFSTSKKQKVEMIALLKEIRDGRKKA
jgi:hypothetical protein